MFGLAMGIMRSRESTSQLSVILNADDFGWDSDTVDTTIECFDRGWLTSASVMTNMPLADRALEFAAGHPEFGFGLHLCYCSDGDEYPLSPASEIPDLLGQDGQFLPSNQLRWRALLGKVSVPQIILETRRQIAKMVESGVQPTHVDSHGHLHKFRPFREALGVVLGEFGISRVRGIQDIYIAGNWRSPTYWLKKPWQARLARLFDTADHLYMPASDGPGPWPDRLLDVVGPGILEVGVHPGKAQIWRAKELRDLGRFVECLPGARVELATWAKVGTNHGCPDSDGGR